jgi:DNA-binding MarR family transcriptional regulator
MPVSGLAGRSPRPIVRRADAGADARGVVVALTDAGKSRLTETAPVHARGIADLFGAKLNDQELAALESALAKVTLNCGFG